MRVPFSVPSRTCWLVTAVSRLPAPCAEYIFDTKQVLRSAPATEKGTAINAFDALHPRDDVGRFTEKQRTAPEFSLDELLKVPPAPEPLHLGDQVFFHEDGFEPVRVEVVDVDPLGVVVKERSLPSTRGPAVWSTHPLYLSADHATQRDREATARVRELGDAALEMTTRELRAVADRFARRPATYQAAVDALGEAADEATRIGRYEGALREAERVTRDICPRGGFGNAERALANALMAEALRDLALDENFERMTVRDYQVVVAMALPRRVGMPIS